MPMVYSHDIIIAATAYVVADNEEEALEIFKASFSEGTIEVPDGYVGDGVEITGATFHADMPEATLSPAMTIHGFAGKGWEPLKEPINIEEVAEIDDDDE